LSSTAEVLDVAWVRRELDAIGIPPLKRFGQHFLFDSKVRDELIELGDLTAADTVLEVGPGLGFLTSALVEKAGNVIAVEKDRTLAAYLRNRFSNYRNVSVIQGDILDTNIPDNAKIVSSPPYNISSRLVLQILNSRFEQAALLMQEEFVGRLTASPGSREYGRLTVMLQFRARAICAGRIPRSAFYPQPRVDSALVTIKPIARSLIKNRELFEDLVRVLFTQRRRKLLGVLTRFLQQRYPDQSDQISKRITIPEKRIFEITPPEFGALSNQIEEALINKGGAS
jgi:16S rRNA (adenine1518-N6/adenine1519-N6)-dimethyltransferase